MTKKVLLAIIVVFAIGCTNSQNSNEIIRLKKEIENLNSENKELKNTIELIKYPAPDRLKQIKELIVSDSFARAKEEISLLQTLFPQSIEAKECKVQKKIMEEKQIKIRKEEERIKALGFKSLKEVSTIKVFYNKVSVGNFSTSRTFTFDAYDDSWHLFTADRGNKYISARITITSTNKAPELPVFYAYSVNGDKLECEGSFILRFARWEDYATYLGNYNDNSNDFSKTATIPFKIGIEVSNKVASAPLVIICRKQNCMIRNYDRFNDPPVSYSTGSRCTYDTTLTLDGLKNGYAVVKVLNRSKL